MSRQLIVVAMLAAALPAALRAQSVPHVLAGRHQLTVTAGLNTALGSTTTVDVGGVAVTNTASGALGGIGYAYWPEDRLSLTARIAAMDASADASVSGGGVTVEANAVGTLQLGVRYQFARLGATNTLRPHLAASVGPLFGSAETVASGLPTTVATITQTVASGQVSLGVEASLGRIITLGADAGYFLAQAFDQRVGARTDYSSPVFTLSLGVLIGRGRVAGDKH